ncbi:hypothetical protein IJ843_06880 [bacterium]|nr:hypothetical protein [bacterium]
MTVNSISLAQNLIAPSGDKAGKANVSFKGGTPDLDALRAKQDEFRRMSEQSGGDNGILGKLGNFASKAIGVVIAFTATKICLGKAADMITGYMGKAADKAVATVSEKAAEKAVGKTAEEAAKLTAKADKLVKMVDKVKSSKIDKYAVNIIAGGAALGVAMKDFGLVNKSVSDSTENLVDNAIDNANGNGYNSYGSSSSGGDYNVSEDEF